MKKNLENGSRIAVIGGGIAGLTAAYLLQKKHHVTLFEKENYIGGHAKTVVVEDGVDAGKPLDIGFQVFNQHSYPSFMKLLAQFTEVNYQTSDISWSYFSRLDGFQYRLKSPRIKNKNSLSQEPMAESEGEFRPQPPKIAQLYKEIWQFKKKTKQEIISNHSSLKQPLINYLIQNNFSKDIIERYIIPFGAAIWSMPSDKVLKFPAEAFIYYLNNHGFLDVKNFREWLYIEGGSKSYIKAILTKIRGNIETQMPISKVIRTSDRVLVHFTKGGSAEFDYVVMATHADEALNLLADPSEKETRFLGAWQYSLNPVVLHSDSSIISPHRSHWASWNYTRYGNEENDYNFSYYLNSIQKHQTEKDYFLTLNGGKTIDSNSILMEVNFTHPIYSLESMSYQPRLPELNGEKRTYYCGSYFGCGFHEDAVKSGLAVARSFGIQL